MENVTLVKKNNFLPMLFFIARDKNVKKIVDINQRFKRCNLYFNVINRDNKKN